MNKIAIFAAFATFVSAANGHMIDQDCATNPPKYSDRVPATSGFVPPDSVEIKISRDYEPYPLGTGLSPVHETVTVDLNVTKVVQFDGDDHHIQVGDAIDDELPN